MPPFLTVMGALYLVVAVPFLCGFVGQGYWRGMGRRLFSWQCLRWLSLVVVATLSCIQYWDVKVTLALKAVELKLHWYTFWDFICSCAEGDLVGGVLFSLMLLATYFKLLRLAEVARISLMSSIYAGLTNGVLKFIFNRQRPAIGLEQWNFFAFFRHAPYQWDNLFYAYNSMPSGHTITTVAAVIPFVLVYRRCWQRALGIWWIAMVGVARVYTINHWLSDVLIAIAFGALIGYTAFQINCWRLNSD